MKWFKNWDAAFKKVWGWLTIYRVCLIALWAIFLKGAWEYDPYPAWVGLILITYIEHRFGAPLDVVVKVAKEHSSALKAKAIHQQHSKGT